MHRWNNFWSVTGVQREYILRATWIYFNLCSLLSCFYCLTSFERSCCVQITKKHYAEILSSLPPSSVSKLREFNYTVLVGISHSKSRNRMPSSQGDRYNYLSRLYAFSIVEPYDIIARSGLFCFGFPDCNRARRWYGKRL